MFIFDATKNNFGVKLSDKVISWGDIYPVGIEDFLDDNETFEVEIQSTGTIDKYKYSRTINGKVISIENFFPSTYWSNNRTLPDFIMMLRAISDIIARESPKTASYIKFADDVMVDWESIFEKIELSLIDGRRNRPQVWFLSPESKEKYSKKYKKFLQSKTMTRSVVKDIKVIALDNYILLQKYGQYIILDYDSVMASEDPISYVIDSIPRFIRYSFQSQRVIKMKNETIFAYDEKVSLKSPPNVPSNAFIIGFDPDDAPAYIQFTKQGIVKTNGIFFMPFELEEVTLPWYIVRKNQNGWDIFFFDYEEIKKHAYRIRKTNGGQVLLVGLGHADDDDTIYAEEGMKIYNNGDHFIVRTYYDKKIPKKKVERAKIIYRNKIIYVPLAAIEKFFEATI